MQIPNNIPLDKEGQYCSKCFTEGIQRTNKKGLTYYYCTSCKETSGRSLVIDNGIVWWVDEDTKEYWHESVGVMLFNNNNAALFFDRKAYPFALAIPAGHLDADEQPEAAIKRELVEETGIQIKQLKLFSQENIIGDKCRRGADNHKWHLFTSHVQDVGNIHINDEGANPVWLTIEEASKKELVYPLRYFIEKYGKKLLSW